MQYYKSISAAVSAAAAAATTTTTTTTLQRQMFKVETFVLSSEYVMSLSCV